MKLAGLGMWVGVAVLATAGAVSAQAQCEPEELAKLVASDPGTYEYFGTSVALSGDTAVIGSYWHDHPGGTNAGAAYVFVRSGAVWTEQAKLVASDPATYEYFGNAVAVSGDTAVIGAVCDTHSGGTYAGSADVFVRSGGVWTREAKLTASDAAANDWFGVSVAVSSDTAVIGALQDDHAGGTDAGSAYIFVRSGGTWIQEAKLTASDAASNKHFGCSVALSNNTVVIGAYGEDYPGGPDASSAYVFVRSAGVWPEAAKLMASDGAGGDEFGFSVALRGGTAVIGAPYDGHAGGPFAGSAYVFDLNCEPPPASITAWRSVRNHGTPGPGEPLAIDLDSAATGAQVVSETRSGGVQRIEVDFDGSVSGSIVGTVAAEDLTHGGAIPASDRYTINEGTTLAIEFAGGLPDEACYQIDLAGNVLSLIGDTDCLVRGLAGDTNGDGLVDNSDMIGVRIKRGQDVAGANCVFDVTGNGVIDNSDMIAVRVRRGHSAVCP